MIENEELSGFLKDLLELVKEVSKQKTADLTSSEASSVLAGISGVRLSLAFRLLSLIFL